MKSKILLILTILFSGISLNAQTDTCKFRLEVDAPHHKGETAYLLSYWNENTYITDLCQISPQGIGLLKSEESLPTGQYVLYIKPNVQLELLLDNDVDNIKVSVSKDIVNSKVEGSKDTEVLWDYINHLNEYNLKKSDLFTNNKEQQTESKIAAAQQKSDLLDSQFNNYTQKLVNDNKGLWVSAFIKSMTPVAIPYSEPQNNDENEANTQYVREHYFDNLSLTDPRLLRTNYFWTYLDNYLNNWVAKDIDSLANATSDLVARSMGNKICFEQVLMRYINNAINSNQMGMENVWAKLAEDYIFDKDIANVDSLEINALRSKYEVIKYNRIGMIAHGLRLETIEGDTIQLHDIEASYMILYFYDPTCSHCQIETKHIHEKLYPQYKDKGLKILTVNILPDQNRWKEFVERNNISDWINCADPEHKSRYWMYYNTTGVPSVYILDSDKKIIAKGIDENGLEQVFKILYKE